MTGSPPTVTWQFQRLGGLDQVTLRTAAELERLGDLNPKLWTALSCPAFGLEYDTRTLELIDSDKDGRIRVPEVVDAVSWLTPRLNDMAYLADAPRDLPLERINTETPEGKNLLRTAKTILEALGKPEAAVIAHADVAEALANAAKNLFNGDGVITDRAEFDPETRAFIKDALAVVGGVYDAGGEPGINRDIAEAFAASLGAWQAWRQTVDRSATPLGPDTAEAWALLQELAPKLEDYFLRAEMASFAPWLRQEPSEAERPVVFASSVMDPAALEDMPIARVGPERPLDLSHGVNPAWRKRLSRFGMLVRPLLHNPEEITAADRETLRAAFKPYEEALAQRPEIPALAVTVPPTGAMERIGEKRVAAALADNTLAAVLGLIAKDAAAPSAATDIADLERLVLYHAHLHRLLMNFVSFLDFYSLRDNATFQAGTLYIDGRSCRLCLPVAGDIEKHAELAALSRLFLVYCRCVRVNGGPGSESEAMGIVAAVTAGDADMLVAGRNGVFMDFAGRDWDATVLKVVSNPISIRQAAWEPYKRMAKAIGEMVAKFTASKKTDITKTLESKVTEAGTDKAPSFDLGKSMGIFAAIGLAIGAIGTAVASLAGALLSLTWVQIPLVFAGAFLLISGPSMVLAWLKLRKRTLGPLLEASGWAVNSLVPINRTLGKQLTNTAALPKNSRRHYNDPLRKPNRWPALIGIITGIAIAVAAYLHLTGKAPFMR